MRHLLPGLLLLTLVPLLAVSYRLSEEENEALQKTCGKKSMQRKVLNGELTSVVDHPWAVALYIRHPHGVFMGPATIISPRHILTFNTIRIKNGTLNVLNTFDIDEAATCEGRHLVLPRSLMKKFDVDTLFLSRRRFADTVEQVTIVDGCRTLNEKNPVIVELHDDMRFNRNHRPACVSNAADNWLEQEQFTMFGVNKTGVVLLSAQLATVPCDSTTDAAMSCAVATREDQGLCSGDFGGSAVATIGGRSTVLGVYSKGNVRCKSDPKSHGKYKFVNVGFYRDTLCQLIGVCVEAPEVSPTTTTKRPPFVPDVEVRPPGSSEEEVPAEVTESTRQQETSTESVGEPIYATEEPTTEEPITEEPTTEMTTSSGSSESSESSEESPALETIVAETFEKLKLNGTLCSEHDDQDDQDDDGEGEKHNGHVKNIHIHIHLK